jgi:ABC-type lipoprotein export system ATPase subunit
LEARGVEKRYDEDGEVVVALRGVDLSIEPGELVAVMGPSGCGKSTLLHLLGALDTPSDGEVLLDGRPLASLDDRELTLVRRRRVGFVFQFFNLVPVLTVAENVALPAVIDGRALDERAARLTHVLDASGITDIAAKLPSQLSGGQQQRVAVARALMNDPAVLLADEPTGNLDLRSGQEIVDLFLGLHDRGHTILVVTHNPVVAGIADRVVFLRDGRVVDDVALGRAGPEAVLARIAEQDRAAAPTATMPGGPC